MLVPSNTDEVSPERTYLHASVGEPGVARSSASTAEPGRARPRKGEEEPG